LILDFRFGILELWYVVWIKILDFGIRILDLRNSIILING